MSGTDPKNPRSFCRFDTVVRRNVNIFYQHLIRDLVGRHSSYVHVTTHLLKKTTSSTTSTFVVPEVGTRFFYLFFIPAHWNRWKNGSGSRTRSHSTSGFLRGDTHTHTHYTIRTCTPVLKNSGNHFENLYPVTGWMQLYICEPVLISAV